MREWIVAPRVTLKALKGVSLSSAKWRRGAGRGGGQFFATSPCGLSPHSRLAGREALEVVAAPSPTPSAVAQKFANPARPVPPACERGNAAAFPRRTHPLRRLRDGMGNDRKLHRRPHVDADDGWFYVPVHANLVRTHSPRKGLPAVIHPICRTDEQTGCSRQFGLVFWPPAGQSGKNV